MYFLFEEQAACTYKANVALFFIYVINKYTRYVIKLLREHRSSVSYSFKYNYYLSALYNFTQSPFFLYKIICLLGSNMQAMFVSD